MLCKVFCQQKCILKIVLWKVNVVWKRFIFFFYKCYQSCFSLNSFVAQCHWIKQRNKSCSSRYYTPYFQYSIYLSFCVHLISSLIMFYTTLPVHKNRVWSTGSVQPWFLMITVAIINGHLCDFYWSLKVNACCCIYFIRQPVIYLL